MIGENLPEFEILQYPSVTQAYYVCCHTCSDDHASNPAAKAFFNEQAADIAMKHRLMLEEEQDAKVSCISTSPSETQSLTSASTLDDSAIATPFFGTERGDPSSRKKGRGLPASSDLDVTPFDDPGFGVSPCDSDQEGRVDKAKRKRSPECKKAMSPKRLKLSMSPRTPLRYERS